MNETLKIQISAYVDGELSERESELLIRRMSQDPELRELAESYMGIGRALRGEPEWVPGGLLRDRVARDIGVEPAVIDDLPAAGIQGGRLLRPLAGVAIAAGVAVLAIFGLQQVGPVAGTGTLTVSNDLAAIAIDEAPLYTEPPVAEFVDYRPSPTLERYYQEHNDRAADHGSSGIFPRLVELQIRSEKLDSQRPEEAATPADASDGVAEEDRR